MLTPAISQDFYHLVNRAFRAFLYNIAAYRYSDSHYKDKMVLRRYYFIMEFPITDKMVFTLKQGQGL